MPLPKFMLKQSRRLITRNSDKKSPGERKKDKNSTQGHILFYKHTANIQKLLKKICETPI